MGKDNKEPDNAKKEKKSGNGHDNEIAVWAITPDGFISAPIFESIALFKDIITPYPSNLTGYQNGNANYIIWIFSIDDNFNAYKIVVVEDHCISQV